MVTTLLYFPLYLYFVLKNKYVLKQEVETWYRILPIDKMSSNIKSAVLLLSLLPEFRSVLYFRYNTHRFNPLKWIYRTQVGLFIGNDQKIGSGLVIQHGFSTIINAEKVGDNCQIWQNVTIGKAHSGKSQPRPIIGNNVKICCHAVVLGGVTIGDNVTVGASCVVVKDVPPNCTVVGNPARILKK